ncbi:MULTISPECIES: type II toxin-antitoxin system VapC family toxin [Methylocystis]|uniref:type II toxin-antitoxin system VapC family toxin n=1 Tax=Methylocystis TaxID=133 RepID=UPI001920E493|nr:MULTISPECIES: type II toxin-antitoxin system VapC family toxin [Methylocystis]MBL1256142.1 type II toxin-antitoxin system VapC family toxin [Methylocystis sp. Sn-Cys]
MILLDTNIVSEFIKPTPNARVEAWLDSRPLEHFFLCTPVLAELRYGAALLAAGRRKKAFEESFDRLEQEIFRGRILVFDLPSAHRYGVFRADRQRRGRSFAVVDIMIAAIASAHTMTLATRNTSDFDGLDVALVDPFTA